MNYVDVFVTEAVLCTSNCILHDLFQNTASL